MMNAGQLEQQTRSQKTVREAVIGREDSEQKTDTGRQR